MPLASATAIRDSSIILSLCGFPPASLLPTTIGGRHDRRATRNSVSCQVNKMTANKLVIVRRNNRWRVYRQGKERKAWIASFPTAKEADRFVERLA